MKSLSLLTTLLGSSSRLAASEGYLAPAMRITRVPRLFSTSSSSNSDKEVPENRKHSKNEVDADGYNVKELESKEQKVRFDEFKKYMETNSYYEKYKARIVAAQKSSPKAFLAMVENVIPLKKKKKDFNERLRASNVVRKPLGEIMKIDMLMDLPKDDIVFIWQEYHKSIKSVGAAMSGLVYDNTEKLGRKYSTFILPLPKNGGYEFYLLQYGGETFHFTQLVKYHMYKENSPVCLTLNFYKDLRSTKDVVLVRGEVDTQILTLEEAQHLLVQFNYYYAEGSQSRLELLKKFNESPSEFDHEAVIEELNQLLEGHVNKFPALDQVVGRSSNS